MGGGEVAAANQIGVALADGVERSVGVGGSRTGGGGVRTAAGPSSATKILESGVQHDCIEWSGSLVVPVFAGFFIGQM